MALSIFDNKTHQPSNIDLTIKLGETFSFWKEIVAHMHGSFQNVVEEWAYSGEKYGWSLRLCLKKRRIIYLIPGDQSMKVGMVLGQRAFEKVAEMDLHPSIKELILGAPKYGEGYGFRFDLEHKEMVNDVKRLIELKAKN